VATCVSGCGIVPCSVRLIIFYVSWIFYKKYIKWHIDVLNVNILAGWYSLRNRDQAFQHAAVSSLLTSPVAWLIFICRTAMRVTKYMVTGFRVLTPCILVNMYRNSEERAAAMFRIKLYSESAGSVSLLKSVALLPKNVTSRPEDVALRSQLCA
jgi:hypothetical protein